MPYGVFRQVFGPPVVKKTSRVSGEENLPTKPPFIVAVNHIGFMDAPALVMYLYNRFHRTIYFPTRHFFWKLLGSVIAKKWLGMILLRNDNKKGVLEEVIAMAASGEIVGIFPEGTRNQDTEKLLPGKTGAVRLALATGVPLIPIGIRNTTGRNAFAAFRSLLDKKTEFTLEIGPAVDLSEYQGKPIDKSLLVSATKKLMQSIGSLCGKEYPY